MSLILPTNARGPILDLALPASEGALDITLRNVTTGKTLTTSLPAEWAGDDLSLDFYRRTIRDQAGRDRSALLDIEDNELWSPMPLIPGINDLEIEVRQILSTGPVSAESCADNAAVGTAAWANPANAKTSNNAYATVLLGGSVVSHYLEWTSFPLSLPVGADVAGVGLEIERSLLNATGIRVTDYRVRLLKGGSVLPTERASSDEWASQDSLASYGGERDLWDTTWESSDFVGSGFGALIAIQRAAGTGTVTAQIDAGSVEVFYRAPQSYKATATLRWEKGYY